MRTPLMLITLLAGCMVGGGDQSFAVADDVHTVEVELSSGDVQIRTDTEATGVLVMYSGGGIGADAVRPDVSVLSGHLSVDAAAGLFSGGDLEVVIPIGVAVIARVDRGSIAIDLDEAADISACVGAGSVEIAVPTGRWDLDLDAGAGSVAIHDVQDDSAAPDRIHACVGAGDIAVRGG
jgi:hypothetical protein